MAKDLSVTNSNTSRINLPEAIKLYFIEGKSQDELAAKYGCTQSAISQKINNFLPVLTNPNLIKSFIDNRAGLLAGLQMELLSSITPEKLKKISPRDAVVSAGILFDKERLETGQSTSNIALQGTFDLIQARSGGATSRHNRDKGKDKSIKALSNGDNQGKDVSD